MAQALPHFEKFDISETTTLGTRWEEWVERFELFITAMAIADDTRRRAMLLHYAGAEVHRIFKTLIDTGNAAAYETAKNKLTEYFKPSVNTEYEKYIFHELKQREQETLDSYHTRLREQGAKCGLTHIDADIKSQIIRTCTSNKLRRKVLRESTLTLKNILDHGRAREVADTQAMTMEKKHESEEVNVLREQIMQMGIDMKMQNRTRNQSQYQSNNRKCYNCGGSYPHLGKCPADGKKCFSCNKLNHFSRVCRSNRTQKIIHHIDRDSSSEEEVLHSVYEKISKVDKYSSKPDYITLKVADVMSQYV